MPHHTTVISSWTERPYGDSPDGVGGLDGVAGDIQPVLSPVPSVTPFSRILFIPPQAGIPPRADSCPPHCPTTLTP